MKKLDKTVLVLAGVFLLMIIKFSTAGYTANIVYREKHFILYSDQVIKDTKTGLEWYYRHGDWGAGVSEFEARKWVKNLTVAGGGWRLPAIKELFTLYKTGTFNQGRKVSLRDKFTGNRSWVFWEIEPWHKCRNGWVWSGETVVQVRGVFLGSGVSYKLKTAGEHDDLLYFNFNRGDYEDTGPNAFLENINWFVAGLIATKPVHAGAFAVRKARR